MSLWLRLCLGLAILVPSLAHAAWLDIPSNGDKLSGIGLISGWKCEANGEITIVFNEGDSETASIPTKYGAPRSDTSSSCGDDDGNNGFYALWNWGLLGDGEHTAVAYDNGVEFARSTFSVTTAGQVFLPDAPDTPVVVQNFPKPGQTTTFQWNRSTQHLEMVMWTAGRIIDRGTCVEELTVRPGEVCSDYLTIAGSDIRYFFIVAPDGRACIDGTDVTTIDGCHAASLPDALIALGVAATKNADGSWTLDLLPSSGPVDLGMCTVGLTVNPKARCSGAVRSYGYTFTVEAQGRACISGLGLLDGCHDTSSTFSAVMAITGAAVTKNTDNSWTIDRLPQ